MFRFSGPTIGEANQAKLIKGKRRSVSNTSGSKLHVLDQLQDEEEAQETSDPVLVTKIQLFQGSRQQYTMYSSPTHVAKDPPKAKKKRDNNNSGIYKDSMKKFIFFSPPFSL